MDLTGSSLLAKPATASTVKSSTLSVLCVRLRPFAPLDSGESLGLGRAQRPGLGLEFGDELVERHH